MQAIRTHEKRPLEWLFFWDYATSENGVPFATHEYTPTQVHCCCDDVVTASSGAKHGTGSARCAERSAFGQLAALFASTFSRSCYRQPNFGLCLGQTSQVHLGRWSMTGGISYPTSGGISFHS
jgi:hypothetical protein